jgi:hypothetical protein
MKKIENQIIIKKETQRTEEFGDIPEFSSPHTSGQLKILRDNNRHQTNIQGTHKLHNG